MKSQDSSESATKQQDEGNVTLGPRSMAKLRKAAAKLNESKAIDMNKTAPAQVIVEAQNIRKKRSRSVTHENVKREKLEVKIIAKILFKTSFVIYNFEIFKS